MNLEESSDLNLTNFEAWVCPNLKIHWQILPVVDSEKIFLQAIKTEQKILFSADEGYALKHFDGTLTVKQVQEKCQKEFGSEINPNFIVQLLDKLVGSCSLSPIKKGSRENGDGGMFYTFTSLSKNYRNITPRVNFP